MGKAEDTRDAILEAAAETFAEAGFGSARVDEIARRAGVNKATVYYHIGGKERLYATVIGAVVDGATRALDQALTGVDDPSERFRVAIAAIARTAESHPHFAPLLLREVASGGASLPDEVLLKVSGVFRIIATILHDGAVRKDFHRQDPVITHMLVAGGLLFIIAGTPIRERIRGILGSDRFTEPSPEQIPAEVAKLILEGLSRNPPKTARQQKKERGER